MTPEVWAGVSVVLCLVTLAVTAIVLKRTQDPTTFASRLRELELQVADIADFVERKATRDRVRKMREGREAAGQVVEAPQPGTPEHKAALRALARSKGLQ